MTKIKLIIAVLTLFVTIGTTQLILADTGCTPPTLTPACSTCVCSTVLADDCTQENRIMEVYTINPDCIATVFYRIKKCSTQCILGINCQILIDSITVDEPQNDCVTCEVSTAGDMKEFFVQIERMLLMHGGFYGPCGYNPTGNNTFNYTVGKPACWKKSSSGGGGLVNGIWKAKYEPCNRNTCCVSSYCVDIDQYGGYTINKTGPVACPQPPPINCASGCSGGLNICADPN